MIYQSEPVKFEHYGYVSSYNQIDISNPRQHFQRHIFLSANPDLDDVGEWEPTALYTEEKLLKRGYKKMSINQRQ